MQPLDKKFRRYFQFVGIYAMGLKVVRLCRICEQKEETLIHLICECMKHAQKEYK